MCAGSPPGAARHDADRGTRLVGSADADRSPVPGAHGGSGAPWRARRRPGGAACEVLGERYAAAPAAYTAALAPSNAAWGAYIKAHNANRPGRDVARVKARYDRSTADLDRRLADIAAVEQAARTFGATHQGAVCHPERPAGHRYRHVPPPKG